MTRNNKVRFVGVCLLVALSGHAWAVGAIALDDVPGGSPGDVGYGFGFGDSKESAQKAALARCNGIGNGTCRVVVWFEKCGAYAISHETYGIGWGDSEEDAKSKALIQCGEDLCRVVASGCSP